VCITVTTREAFSCWNLSLTANRRGGGILADDFHKVDGERLSIMPQWAF
jgi:hypothetical protein